MEPAGPEFGTLFGTVSDDELRPIGGANVSLLKAEREAVTDASGRYAIEGLAPGVYAVAVLVEGFEPDARKAEVFAGEATWANFTLRPLPTIEPYVEVIPRRAFVQFAQRQLNNLALNLVNMTCQGCKHPLLLDQDPYAVMTEFVFEPSINYPVGSKKVCAEWHRNYTGDNPFYQGSFIANACLRSGENRTLQRAEAPNCSNCVRAPKDQITMYIVGQEPFDCVGCQPNFPVVQQRVDIWFSIAHYAPLPFGWTAIPPR